MSEYRLFLVVILLGLIAAAFFLHLPPRRSQTQDDQYSDRRFTDAAYPDDGQHWLGGLIYNNPDDPNLFVPKRFGFGWTLNFGHPQGRLILVGLLVLILVLVVIGPLTGGSSATIGYHPSGRGFLP